MINLDLTAFVDKIDDYENTNGLPEDLKDLDLNDYLSKKARSMLHHGTGKQNKARIQFITYFNTRLQHLTQNGTIPRPGITMNDLLGTTGVKLFEAAIKEEAQSKAFREAVFLQSMNCVQGPEWDKKVVLWVGGPSASGKTFGSENAMKSISDFVPVKDMTPHRNDYIIIDGATEREVSQMRKLVLQVALAYNYKGITDLNDHCEYKVDGRRVKEYVQMAATEHKSLSLVIPETFTESMFSFSNRYKTNDMIAFDSDPNVFQAFSQVTGDEETFQDVVKYMGSTRAWLGDDETFDEHDLSLNNKKIPCESKAYGSSGFKWGCMASTEAAKRLAQMDPTSLFINITNDLILVKQQPNGTWLACTSSDNPDFKISVRDFRHWKENVEAPENTNLKAWWNQARKNGQLAPPLIDIKPNDLVQIPVSNRNVSPDLKFLQITARDADRYHEELGLNRGKLQHVRAWLKRELEHGRLTTPESLVRDFLDKSKPVKKVKSKESLIVMDESTHENIHEVKSKPREKRSQSLVLTQFDRKRKEEKGEHPLSHSIPEPPKKDQPKDSGTKPKF